MSNGRTKRRLKNVIKYVLVFGLAGTMLLMFLVNRFVEPLLRDRLHTLIVQGSDSLYYYQLGKINANLFGGNVEVQNLHIRVDSNHYKRLLAMKALPALTMQLDLQRGRIRGLSVVSFLFSKKIHVREILSKEADVKLSRHVRDVEGPGNTTPLWKAMQPNIKSISVDRINLDGMKLLYKNADTAEAVKLQFDRCEAVFRNIQIDSASTVDTTRIGFAKSLAMNFYDLKFRTPDSTYKMKAEQISYSSIERLLRINDFKIQSTLEKDEFFQAATLQSNRYEIQFKEAVFSDLRLDRFIHSNVIAADSVWLNAPEIEIANDKTLPPTLESKFGRYPHQNLLKAGTRIAINGIRIKDGRLTYTERAEKTKQEGKLEITHLNAQISNVTNEQQFISKNARCLAKVDARLFGDSRIQTQFTFPLDSINGNFAVVGEAYNISGIQLNKIAEPLANIKIQSLQIPIVKFQVRGDDYSTSGDVKMRYHDLAIIFRKTNEETGAVTTKKFLTKLINKYTIYPSNPSEGVEREANNVIYARTSTKGFFAVVWKTIFAGMQNIMMKTGRYE
jgi:hypothetical protein